MRTEPENTYVHGPVHRESCAREKLEVALEIIAGMPPARSFADECKASF